MSGRPPNAVSLRDILDELRLIRQAIERPRPESSLSRADRVTLARLLLPPVAGVRGSELFLVRDLFESDAVALGLVLRGLNARQVGHQAHFPPEMMRPRLAHRG